MHTPILGDIDVRFGVECGRRHTTVRIFMPGSHLFRASIALSLLALCTSCAEIEGAKKAAVDAARTATTALRPTSAYWNAHGVSGRPKIIVRLGDQRAYFCKGKTVVGESSIST